MIPRGKSIVGSLSCSIDWHLRVLFPFELSGISEQPTSMNNDKRGSGASFDSKCHS